MGEDAAPELAWPRLDIWEPNAHPMKRRKDGSFSLNVKLSPGQTLCYRYLLDGTRWESDWAADAYAANSFGTEDSVVHV